MRALNNLRSPGSGLSRPVSSSQSGLHARLDSVVLRHLHCTWRQPLHRPSVAAFRAVQELLEPKEAHGLVLDAGCGTGASTAGLAERHPGRLVIGIDRSATRLRQAGAGENPCRHGNVILVRAELATFWRLALDAGWRLGAHYLLYPNPWPKPRHLMRRWHTHPVFPVLLNLGGELILRTNWEVYAREFARAVQLATGQAVEIANPSDFRPLSPFERKYAASGHVLYEISVIPDGPRG